MKLKKINKSIHFERKIYEEKCVENKVIKDESDSSNNINMAILVLALKKKKNYRR